MSFKKLCKTFFHNLRNTIYINPTSKKHLKWLSISKKFQRIKFSMIADRYVNVW